ncbi:MAG: hypothetical protein KC535_02825 [Nanoarchaeota archaeon]|nr:hypothetical protein [Nanoarchaeota archaeon]
MQYPNLKTDEDFVAFSKQVQEYYQKSAKDFFHQDFSSVTIEMLTADDFFTDQILSCEKPDVFTPVKEENKLFLAPSFYERGRYEMSAALLGDEKKQREYIEAVTTIEFKTVQYLAITLLPDHKTPLSKVNIAPDEKKMTFLEAQIYDLEVAYGCFVATKLFDQEYDLSADPRAQDIIYRFLPGVWNYIQRQTSFHFDDFNQHFKQGLDKLDRFMNKKKGSFLEKN